MYQYLGLCMPPLMTDTDTTGPLSQNNASNDSWVILSAYGIVLSEPGVGWEM